MTAEAVIAVLDCSQTVEETRGPEVPTTGPILLDPSFVLGRQLAGRGVDGGRAFRGSEPRAARLLISYGLMDGREDVCVCDHLPSVDGGAHATDGWVLFSPSPTPI